MRRPLLLFGILLAVALGALAEPSKKIVMLVPNDFMWPEYQLPFTAYRQAGFTVSIASRDGKKVSPDARNLKEYDCGPVEADLSFAQVVVSDYDAITTVGGNGAWVDLFPDADAHRIIRESLSQGKITALLCASTGLLGLVQDPPGCGVAVGRGRKVTGYYKVEDLLRRTGAVNWTPGAAEDPTVVRDGKLITGRNPAASEPFGKTVVQALTARE